MYLVPIDYQNLNPILLNDQNPSAENQNKNKKINTDFQCQSPLISWNTHYSHRNHL